jgi:hypothetical protein
MNRAADTPPLSAVYLNIQEARASAALPAAGAWDAAPIEMACPYFDHVKLTFTYIRGAPGGAFEWRIEPSDYSIPGNVPAGAEEWSQGSLYAPGIVAPGTDSTSLVQREQQSYTSQGAAAESVVYGPIALEETAERLRVSARETGVPGTPGTLQIQAVYS